MTAALRGQEAVADKANEISTIPVLIERLAAKVGEDDLHFAPVILVDRAGRIEAGDAVLEREARTWPDLHFIARRNLDREAGRHRPRRSAPL